VIDSIQLQAFLSVFAVTMVGSMGLLDWAVHRRPNYVRHART
jgi:hypothetical protein